MSSTSGEAKVVLPTFDGKKDSFQVWWIRFQAYAHLKGFKASFEKEADLPSSEKEALDVTIADGKKKQAAKDRNAMAVSCFTLAFTTTGLLAMEKHQLSFFGAQKNIRHFALTKCHS